MKVEGLIRRTEQRPGIFVHSSDIPPSVVLTIAKKLSQHSQVLSVIPESRFPRILYLSSGDSALEIDINQISPGDFARVYESFDDHSIYEKSLRAWRSDRLASFLQDYGVAAVTTMLKNDMVKRIVGDGRLVYSALAADTSAQMPNFSAAQRELVDDNPKDVVYYATHTNEHRADFWTLEGLNEEIKFDTRSTEIQPGHDDHLYRLRIRQESLPALPYGSITLDFSEVGMHELAKHYGTKATNTRQGTLKALLAQTADQTKAKRVDGAMIYFSFKRPVVLGKPLSDTEFLPLARFVKIISSEAEIFAGTIDASKEHNDFESYFSAAQSAWVALADVQID